MGFRSDMTANKLIYDLWHKDYNEEYEVKEFTEKNLYDVRNWFMGKVASYDEDYEEDDIVSDRAVLLKSGKKLVEGERFALEDGNIFHVIRIEDLENIVIDLTTYD